MSLCGWADASPSGACPGAVTQGRARSAAEGSGSSCESIPPPEIRAKGRIAAGRRNANDRRQSRQGMPLRNPRREFSEITP